MTDIIIELNTAIATDALLTDLRAVTAHDRLQGSTGLADTAAWVAARAVDAGLTVTNRHYEPGHRWWDFTAPTASSPVSASIDIRTASGPRHLTGYPDQPCSIARGCASTPPGGLTLPVTTWESDHNLAGSFVLCQPRGRFTTGALVDQLQTAGARGFALQTPPRQVGGDDAVDRLEVPDDCPLLAFSVSTRQATDFAAAAAHGKHVTIRVAHQPAADMPLVYAHHHGDPRAHRGLLIAHLCHPAPGADDNASGVAALLAAATAICTLYPDGTGPDLTFLWAPEMVGTAAYLHDIALTEPGARPDFALSIDTVGGHGDLVLERPPEHLTAATTTQSPIAPFDRLPAFVHPFEGASDHMLFADRTIGIPAGHLRRANSPARHTSHDAIDLIDPDRLRETAIITTVAATTLSLPSPPTAGTLVSHVVQAMEAVQRRNVTTAHSDPPATTGPSSPEPAIVRRWSGPWNLHNLQQSIPARQRAELGELLSRDAYGYQHLAALALAIDDRAGPAELIVRACRTVGHHILPKEAQQFLAIMRSAGWITTGQPALSDRP